MIMLTDRKGHQTKKTIRCVDEMLCVPITKRYRWITLTTHALKFTDVDDVAFDA